MPSLVERGAGEISQLIDHFLQLKKNQFGKVNQLNLTKEAYEFLTTYHWPGNVRELENVIESLYVMDLPEVTIENLPVRIKRSSRKVSLLLEDVERAHVQKVLDLFQGNQSKAAAALGIAVNTLKSKLK